MFEQSKESLQSQSVIEMLDRLEGRVSRGRIEKNEAEKAISVVSEGVAKAKQITNGQFDQMTFEQIAELSNAWVAFSKEGILKGDENKELRVKLQKLLGEGAGMSPDLKRFARQVWRTEMVAYLIEKVRVGGKVDKGDIVEKMMAAQIVSDKEDDPIEVLTGAMHLDKAIYGKAVRVELAGKMNRSEKNGGVADLVSSFPDDVSGTDGLKIRIVVGGGLLEIPLETAGSLRFKKLVVDGERIYGQMENGCRGNLVVIDFVPKVGGVSGEVTADVSDRVVSAVDRVTGMVPVDVPGDERVSDGVSSVVSDGNRPESERVPGVVLDPVVSAEPSAPSAEVVLEPIVPAEPVVAPEVVPAPVEPVVPVEVPEEVPVPVVPPVIPVENEDAPEPESEYSAVVRPSETEQPEAEKTPEELKQEVERRLAVIASTYGIRNILMWSNGEYDYKDIPKNISNLESALELLASRMNDEEESELARRDVILNHQNLIGNIFPDGLVRDGRYQWAIAIDYNEDPEDIAKDIKNALEEIVEGRNNIEPGEVLSVDDASRLGVVSLDRVQGETPVYSNPIDGWEFVLDDEIASSGGHVILGVKKKEETAPAVPTEGPEISEISIDDVVADIISKTIDLVPEAGDEKEPFYLYPFSAGIGFAEKDGVDNPVYNLVGNEKMRAVAEQLVDALNERWVEVKELSEVDPKVKSAIDSLNSAYGQIRTVVYPNLSAKVGSLVQQRLLSSDYYDKKNGLGLVENFLERSFNPQDYLPIMMKESRLDPTVELGLFQVDSGARAEMKKYYDYTIEGADLKDPVKNSVAGILYYDRCLNRYAQDKIYGDLNDDDTRLLSYALYNKGPTNLRKAWEIIKPAVGGYAAFEKSLSDAICIQLGVPSGDAKTVADASYNVNYLEYPGVVAYLEIDRRDPAIKAVLQNNLLINGKDTGMTVYQAAIMLRYARLVDALREQSDFEGVAMRSLQDVPSEQLICERVYVTPEKGLWSYSNELRRKAMTEWGIMDYFTADDEPGSYLQRDVERQNIIRMIVDFNNERNPAVIGRGGISDSDIVPDVEIWLPNNVYMKAWFDYAHEVVLQDGESGPKAGDQVPVNVPEVLSSAEVMLTPSTNLSSEMVDRLTARTLSYARFQGDVSSDTDWTISCDPEMEKQGLQIPDYNGDYEAFLSGATRPADGKLEVGKVYLPGSGKVIDKDSDRRKTKYIVIHSTNSIAEDRGVGPTVERGRAHFVIGRDGVIHKPRDIEDNFDHVGRMRNRRAQGKWNGDSDVSSTALGIEVATKPGEAFTDAQYVVLKSLVEALGEKYEIPKKNVLCHSQLGCITYNGRVQRFSKPDPANFDWSRIGFPNNYNLIDYDVLNGNMDANFINVLDGDGKSRDFIDTQESMFVGVKASQLLGRDSALATKRSDRLVQDLVLRNVQIVDYTVKKGDNLTVIAKRYGTTASVIMDYNKLSSSAISVGQRIKVPKNYKF